MPHSASLNGAMESSIKIPTVSWWESLFYNVFHVVPAYLRGLFIPSRFWTIFWDRLQPDPAAVKFISRLRRKYHSNYLYIHVLTRRSLLVLDPEGIKQILDNSPGIYADAKLKREGNSHFQPDAVTISRGEQWRDRRRFNETVLDAGLEQYGDIFLGEIKRETAESLQQAGGQIDWSGFATLFDNIALQVIFGRHVVGASSLRTLRRMMRESNRGFALKGSRSFDPFYANIRQRREYANSPSLAALCKRVPATEKTRVDQQIPHWMFAMADTLAINTARALALIVSHPNAEARVREEMALTNVGTAPGIHSLHYLKGCVQEAMRLWPTTPMLVRETLKEDTLGGVTIPVATQVVILNSFNHRDREHIAYADTFSPQIWLLEQSDYRFNHFSNGRQVCAGKELALFIATAVIANLLAAHRYQIRRPRLDPHRPLPYLCNHFQLRLTIGE